MLTCPPPEDNIPPLLPVLLPALTTILKSTTQDPTPCLSLTIKLLSPLPLTRTLTIADPPSLLSALRSPLPGANLLALAILHKAAATPADAAILGTLPELVEELVRRWLDADDVGVAERAARVLGDILETDCDVVPSPNPQDQPQVNGVNGVNGDATQLVRRTRPPGHGHVWALFLESRPITSLIPQLCSPSASRTTHQTSLSQGRLLRLLPRLATLKISALTTTSSPDLFPSDGPQSGLLPWAALAMVDKSDVLMHLNLVDFLETLVSVMRVAENRTRETDEILGQLIRTAVRGDEQLATALRGLPDRTVEEEAEPLRVYINGLLG